MGRSVGGRASFFSALMGSLVLAACWLPAFASAEVRVANALNANRNETGSSTKPVLDGLSARYDTAGDLTLTLIFFEPLAELDALGGWEATVYLADNVGTDQAPICVPLLSRNNFLFLINLGNGPPAEGLQYKVASYRFNWKVSPDRRSIRLRGADPRLANLSLICAHADLTGPSNEYSFIGAQLFSGFGPLDGNLPTTGRWHLASEIAQLNNQLGSARRDPPLGSFARCRRTGRTGLRCSDRTRLPDVRGRPTLALSGRMTVSYTRSLRTRWRRDMRATLSWRRCPASVDPERAGRRCSATRRWRRGQLSRVFRSIGGARASSPAEQPDLRLRDALRPLLRTRHVR